MAEAKATPTSLDGVTSLYRRFRPGRFAELRGQDHVVRALQGAVKNDRVSHAYLFSGPRGTGKTTTARILAKALNCENPVDGDACGVCDSCVAISKGTSLDVIELDAASNNGVDDIREITSGAWHGTPGRWKVYIFDEVHQLSKAASAALLKSLEEPPPHVVFVLATTDPHKVLPTIRSRTQHLEFRLIAGDTLATLLNDIKGAAGLGADDATIEAAVRLGKGSARDALSALDQLLATGSIAESQPEFDALFASLVNSDASGALKALSILAKEGWDAEQLAETFAGEVRQTFLLQVAPEVADAVDADRDRLAQWGSSTGAGSQRSDSRDRWALHSRDEKCPQQDGDPRGCDGASHQARTRQLPRGLGRAPHALGARFGATRDAPSVKCTGVATNRLVRHGYRLPRRLPERRRRVRWRPTRRTARPQRATILRRRLRAHRPKYRLMTCESDSHRASCPALRVRHSCYFARPKCSHLTDCS